MKETYVNFFRRLDELTIGERVALKRSVGIMLCEADGPAITAFYRCLPYDVTEWQAPYWFAVGCIHCLWDSQGTNALPIEQVMATLHKNEALSDSTDHRIASLIDTTWSEDGYMLTKLTRLVKLLRQKTDQQIDCGELLDDLIHWNFENQYVQRKWARAYYAPVFTVEMKGE